LQKPVEKSITLKVKQAMKKNHDVGEEIADVITMVFLVGTKLGIDIEKEFMKKDKIIDKRLYK